MIISDLNIKKAIHRSSSLKKKSLNSLNVILSVDSTPAILIIAESHSPYLSLLILDVSPPILQISPEGLMR